MAVLCIGEMLIDFIGEGVGTIDKVKSFKKEAGGCVANVACVAQKLGHKSYLLTSLGEDGFGDFLENTLKNENVDCRYVSRKADSFTPLAFVSLDETGDRSFSFYFKGSSTLRISKEDVEKVDLSEIEAIHFASIAIQEESKDSHHLLLKKAKEAGVLISFDVNLRFNLWDDHKVYLETIKEFLPYVDVIKVADNELEFLTETTNIEETLKKDFSHMKVVLYTKGEMRICELIEKVLSTSGNITVVIKNMENRGWLYKTVSPEDKRAFLVGLTEEGKKLFENLLPQHRSEIENVYSILTSEEKEKLIEILKKFKNLE